MTTGLAYLKVSPWIPWIIGAGDGDGDLLFYGKLSTN